MKIFCLRHSLQNQCDNNSTHTCVSLRGLTTPEILVFFLIVILRLTDDTNPSCIIEAFGKAWSFAFQFLHGQLLRVSKFSLDSSCEAKHVARTNFLQFRFLFDQLTPTSPVTTRTGWTQHSDVQHQSLILLCAPPSLFIIITVSSHRSFLTGPSWSLHVTIQKYKHRLMKVQDEGFWCFRS